MDNRHLKNRFSSYQYVKDHFCGLCVCVQTIGHFFVSSGQTNDQLLRMWLKFLTSHLQLLPKLQYTTQRTHKGLHMQSIYAYNESPTQKKQGIIVLIVDIHIVVFIKQSVLTVFY